MPLAILMTDNPPVGYEAVLNAVEGSLNSASITGVLTTAVTSAVVLVLLWWSVRKSVSIVKRAFMRGKLRV